MGRAGKCNWEGVVGPSFRSHGWLEIEKRSKRRIAENSFGGGTGSWAVCRGTQAMPGNFPGADTHDHLPGRAGEVLRASNKQDGKDQELTSNRRARK